ncbi:MAG: TlpA family protein disulfide reductase [Planctomycetes bacterium]|nr:TlpA family protein disulfide reductase [Planctomycetota bacterium]
MRKWVYLLIVCLVANAVGKTASEDRYAEWTRVKVGDIVPGFTYTTLAGDQLTSDQLKGKVLFINLFATWCGPCRAEMPHLEALFKKTQHRDFVMVAIGREHSAEDLLAFKREHKLTLPLAADPQRKIYGLFAEKYIPRNIVIGKDRRVKWHSVGYTATTFAEMESVIMRELERSATPKRFPLTERSQRH